MRKTIYVPNEKTWGRIKDEAEKQNKSISSYLLDGTGNDQFDQIEKKLDEIIRLCKGGNDINKPAQSDKFESHKLKTEPTLEEIKKKAKKVVEKIPAIQSASNVFNPQPKGKK